MVLRSTEQYFGDAYVDIDEWRDEPVRHRYVHGGLRGATYPGTPYHRTTDTRFSFYFPPEDRYSGRFLHTLEGGAGGHENTVKQQPDILAFAIERCGAYVVESNQGHIGLDMTQDPTLAVAGIVARMRPELVLYEASEASARFARELATEMYGHAPHHGYLWGISGGGHRTIAGLENVTDVWDGGVAIVPVMTTATFNAIMGQSAAGNLMRVLGPEKLAAVVDAIEPGGSGDPVALLDDDERAVLETTLRCGWAPGALFQLARPTLEHLIRFYVGSVLKTYDTAYYDDFWLVPGYAGADGELAKDVFEATLRVQRVDSAVLTAHPLTAHAGWFGIPVAFTVDGVVPDAARYGTIRITGGASAGAELLFVGARDGTLMTSTMNPALALAAGDEVQLSNRDFLAWSHYHRYVPTPHAPVSGPLRTAFPAFGYPMTGEFNGKLILVPSLFDGAAPAVGGMQYAARIDEAGNTARSRLWCSDHAVHTPGEPPIALPIPPGPPPVMSTRVIDYTGIYQQAIVDLIDWIEQGIEPPPSSSYDDSSGHPELPDNAAERGGIQPVVVATANGAARAEVEAGAAVTLGVTAECPPGAGHVVSVEWDFDGTGARPVQIESIDGASPRVELTVTHVYDIPGTYFPAVRALSHRDGDTDTPWCRAEGLGRARVVVR